MSIIFGGKSIRLLYVLDVVGHQSTVRAWRPAVLGVTEVFHAHFVDHAYPVHTHDSWDLMILDEGAVRFSLDRYEYGSAERAQVILLPPGVPHDGRTVNIAGFRKRVLYLNDTVLPRGLIGAAVDTPLHDDHMLRDRLSALHDCLTQGQQDLEAESGATDHTPCGAAPEPALAGGTAGWRSSANGYLGDCNRHGGATSRPSSPQAAWRMRSGS